jgi:hypothetical protein
MVGQRDPGDKIVRAREFIAEKVIATMHFGDVTVEYDDHIDQQKDLPKRKVSNREIDYVLRRIHQVRSKMLALNHGQRFWIYDPDVNASIGLTMISPTQRRVKLKTTVRGRPWESDRPVFDTKKIKTVAEDTVSGSIATVAVPLGGVISRQLSAKPAKYSNGAPVLTKRKKTDAGR